MILNVNIFGQIELYLLAHHFIVRLGNFKQYQFIPVFYCAVPHEKVSQLKLFHTQSRFFKTIDKYKLRSSGNLSIICHTKMQEKARENNVPKVLLRKVLF